MWSTSWFVGGIISWRAIVDTAHFIVREHVGIPSRRNTLSSANRDGQKVHLAQDTPDAPPNFHRSISASVSIVLTYSLPPSEALYPSRICGSMHSPC